MGSVHHVRARGGVDTEWYRLIDAPWIFDRLSKLAREYGRIQVTIYAPFCVWQSLVESFESDRRYAKAEFPPVTLTLNSHAGPVQIILDYSLDFIRIHVT